MAAKSEGLGVDVDLLGDPLMPLRDPRGRPSFAKNKENQLLVMTLRGAGWKQAEIAEHMRCDEKTLRKHFSRELDHGALLLEGLALQVLVRKMLEGNVGAAMKVRDIAGLRAPKAESTRAEKPAPKGKKELLVEAAHRPTQDWGDLLDAPERKH